MNLNKIIDNYLSRYKTIMYFLYNETSSTINEKLGLKDNTDKKRYNITTLIKLLYLGSYIGLDGENTMIMRININNQKCILTFKIERENYE